MDTYESHTPAQVTAPAAEADAALMDGHRKTSFIPRYPDAAEADAALMDGHQVVPFNGFTVPEAAEADAALMDGHYWTWYWTCPSYLPRRPTRP